MPKKAVFLFALLTLVACFLSYQLGPAPAAYAKSHPSQQDAAAPPSLPTAPATWTLENAGGFNGNFVSVTRPAGGAGVKHVATCVIGTFINISNATVPDMNLSLRDGALNGPILLFWEGTAPPGSSTGVNLCDLNVVGSANTAMTLQIAGTTTSGATVGLVGYDAQ